MTSSDSDWFSEETATFGDRLAGAREAAGLSQRELAGQLGIKTGTLNKWENDLTEPRANRLQMLAGVLGVSLTWLMNAEGDGPSGPAEQEPLDNDIRALLAEMRLLRTQIALNGDKLGQLEKRIRAKLEANQ